MTEATEVQTDFMTETADQAIERWRVGVAPPESLLKQQTEIEGFLGINEKQAQLVRKTLPLVFLKDMESFSDAGFWVEEESGGLVGKIAFKQPEMLTGDDWHSKWGRSEELVHYFHCSANLPLAKDSAKHDRLVRSYGGISEAPALLERAQKYAANELARFIARTGLYPVSGPKTPTELLSAINYSLGTTADPNLEITRLSLGQLARINRALDESGLGQMDEFGKKMLAEYQSYQRQRPGPGRGQTYDEWWKTRIKEVRSSAEYHLKKRISGLLEGSGQKGQEEVIAGISEAFSKAFVPLDRLGYRTSQIKAMIDGLNREQVKDALALYLSQPCTIEELDIISSGLIGNIDWTRVNVSLEKAKRGSAEEAEKTRSEIQAQFVNVIKAAQGIGLTEDDGKRTLTFLFQHARAVAVGQAMIEKQLFWFSDDLPADPEAREKLLKNPAFVQAYEEAVVKALQDPELNTLGEADLNPQLFSRDKMEALQQTRKVLKNALKNSETAAFLVAAKDAAGFQKSGLGTRLPEELEVLEAEEVDRVLLEMGLSLDEIPTGSKYTEAKLKAFQDAMEEIRKHQEDKLLGHRIHIMLEPIAKVITAQYVGSERKDIVFPESMMGGYSELLRTESFENWIDRLWNFVQRNREARNGQAFLEFFQAQSIEDQIRVVDKYLGSKK